MYLVLTPFEKRQTGQTIKYYLHVAVNLARWRGCKWRQGGVVTKNIYIYVFQDESSYNISNCYI